MSSYFTGGTSKTANNLIAASLFATNILGGQPAHAVETQEKGSGGVRYAYPNNASCGIVASVLSGGQTIYKIKEAQTKDVDFEQAVSGFYANLMAHQQPLGKEVSQAIYENLWDLYAS